MPKGQSLLELSMEACADNTGGIDMLDKMAPLGYDRVL